MKHKLLLLILFLGYVPAIFAQPFPVDTILWNGNSEDHINLVYLGDGYQESELPAYLQAVQNFTDELFSQTPFMQYKPYFNVLAIKVPSLESGASHPGTATDVTEPLHPVSTVNNYFGSTFDAFGIHRLLVAQNSGAIFTALATSFPQYDQAIIIVNSPHYGGSGGNYAVTSVNGSANEIAIHELGHSFSNLRDEYWAGNSFAFEGANQTQETDPDAVRWTNWMNENGIGIYQHCCGGQSSNWHRPHQNCKMRTLGSNFCAVCRQEIIEVIHDLTSPIQGYQPEQPEIAIVDEAEFELTLIAPIPNTLHTVWQLNGNIVGEDVDFYLLAASDLQPGLNFLQVSVEDTSAFLRVDDHAANHLHTVLWTIDQTSLSIDAVSESSIGVQIFPNPTSETLMVEITDSKDTHFKVRIFDLAGRLLLQSARLSTLGTTTLDLSEMPIGVLVVKLEFESGLTIMEKVVKTD